MIERLESLIDFFRFTKNSEQVMIVNILTGLIKYHNLGDSKKVILDFPRFFEKSESPVIKSTDCIIHTHLENTPPSSRDFVNVLKMPKCLHVVVSKNYTFYYYKTTELDFEINRFSKLVKKINLNFPDNPEFYISCFAKLGISITFKLLNS